MATRTKTNTETVAWICKSLSDGKTVRHESGMTAFPRKGLGGESFGVTTAGGMKHDFATAALAARFAAKETGS